MSEGNDEMTVVELYRSDNKKHYKTLKFSEDDFMDFIDLVEVISKVFKKKGLFKMIKGKNTQSRLQKLIDLAYKVRKIKIKILVDVDDEEGDEH
jgi:hypothetical protein